MKGGCLSFFRRVKRTLLFLSILTIALAGPHFSRVAAAFSAIPFTVNLAEPVIVTGVPRLVLDIGGVTRYATYTSGSGTSALTFTYTLQAGDLDLDGLTVSSPLELNGGTITDQAGNPATLTFTPPNTSGVKINVPSLSMNFVYDDDGRYSLNGSVYDSWAGFLTASGATFSRAGTATYYDNAGILQSAAANQPRFDHNPSTHAVTGLLIEDSSTNLLLQSQQFTITPWGNNGVTVTPNAITAPDGTMTGTNLIVNASGGSRSLSQGLTASTNYVATVWLRANTATSAAVGLYDAGGTLWGNPSSGSTAVILSGPGTLVPYIAGGALWHVNSLSTTQWTRVAIFRATTSSRFFVYPKLLGQTIGDSVYVWGAQVESGYLPTSYIPTTTTTVTRAADTLTVPASGWFNATSGTMAAEGVLPYLGGTKYPGIVSLNDGTANNAMECLVNDATGDTRSMNIYNAGASTFVSTQSAYTAGAALKCSLGYASGNIRAAIDGVLGTLNTASSIPTLTTLNIGVNRGTHHLNGWVKSVSYFPARVLDAQVQLLTQ